MSLTSPRLWCLGSWRWSLPLHMRLRPQHKNTVRCPRMHPGCSGSYPSDRNIPRDKKPLTGSLWLCHSMFVRSCCRSVHTSAGLGIVSLQPKICKVRIPSQRKQDGLVASRENVSKIFLALTLGYTNHSSKICIGKVNFALTAFWCSRSPIHDYTLSCACIRVRCNVGTGSVSTRNRVAASLANTHRVVWVHIHHVSTRCKMNVIFIRPTGRVIRV
jgi:hypothetical protein